MDPPPYLKAGSVPDIFTKYKSVLEGSIGIYGPELEQHMALGADQYMLKIDCNSIRCLQVNLAIEL